MTPKSFRALERDLDAMISAALAVGTSENSADRGAASKAIRVHRDAIFARVSRMAKNSFQQGVRAARKVTS